MCVALHAYVCECMHVPFVYMVYVIYYSTCSRPSLIRTPWDQLIYVQICEMHVIEYMHKNHSQLQLVHTCG